MNLNFNARKRGFDRRQALPPPEVYPALFSRTRTLPDFRRTAENSAFFHNVDLLILDAQYTLGEAIEKYDWGHTSYSLAGDFAAEWGIRQLALFHHEPSYTDRKIHSMLNSAKWYKARLHRREFEVLLAVEGTEIKV